MIPMTMKIKKKKKKKKIYHWCQLKVRKPTICVGFKPFDFLVQQRENIKPTERNTTKHILFGFVWMEFSLDYNEYACHTNS